MGALYLMAYNPAPVMDRFMAKVQPMPDGCWLWTAAKSSKGYGIFARAGKGRTEQASRSAHWLFIGPIPDGKLVCHHCDRPSCVNPDHLFLGTAAENMEDMVRKWRTRSKLTKEQVIEALSSSDSSRVLALRFGVSRSTIKNIRNRRTFRQVVP